ncbi:TPA: phage tail tape measure protein [Haemophilus influenzae]|uniref:phage tail tape measure protein n=1 Tax=Haemophilus influenzae TaxID=727 RepID=UPI000E330C83|nr:phage tail tape measure protein [Haemophilus influenzae]AXP37800.1 phage tail tape measure protein [Haemophilus influenzae]AXP56089.1 phage tail tape measure protein [Haemophilus influenzae]AXP66344.1 phage tail tape measure protein [Haemophilus influenzae]AYO34414.1 phage tail tape measure protein [Haemophilus influenzae]MCK9649284.1 phage tail tape measure protein [Haemophilus influenzae]
MSSNLAISLVIGASVGGAIAGIKNLRNSLKLFKDESQSVGSRMLGLGKNVALGTSSLISLGTAATTSMLAIAQPAIKFESAMADVKKVVNFDSPAQFKEMEQDILRLTRTIPMASEEIAAIVAAGGQAGIARENLLGYAEDAAKMGVAFEMAAGDAGTAMATMANVLGKLISEMAKFGDAINHLSDNANAKAADIVNVIARAGSDTRMLGLTENQAAALGSTFLSMGKAPEVAAQAIKGMSSAFAELKAGKHAKELQMLGLTPKSFAKAMNKDAQGAISDFIARIKKLPKDKQYPLLAKMFGKQYADDIMLLAQNTAEYNRQLGLLEERDENGNLKYMGSMQREFENRSATTENNLQLLKNSFNEIGIAIGAKLLPPINLLVNKLKPVIYNILEWMNANPELVNQFVQIGGGLVAIIGGFVALKTVLSLGLMAILPFWSGGKKLFSLFKFLTPVLMKLAYGFGYTFGLIAVGAFLIYEYWEPISAFFSTLWAEVTVIFDNVCQFVTNIWNDVQGIWSAVWDGVTNWFTGLWESINGLFNGNFTELGNIILAFNPLSLFQSIFSSVLNYFSVELPAEFTNFGKNIIDGLVNGIGNAWDSAKETVTELGTSVKNWFAEKLGIHSPSRVFMGFGENTVQGLAIGINKSLGLAEKASDEMSNAVGIFPHSDYQSLQTTFAQQQSEQAQHGGMTIHFNPTINVNGSSNNQVLNDVKEGLNISLREFETMLARVLDQQKRRAY